MDADDPALLAHKFASRTVHCEAKSQKGLHDTCGGIVGDDPQVVCKHVWLQADAQTDRGRKGKDETCPSVHSVTAQARAC